MEYIKEAEILLNEELCAKFISEDELKKNPIVKFRENIRLANKIAKGFSEPIDSSMSKEDIYQIAYLGLWEAVLNFDESIHTTFSTYAFPFIKGRVLTALRESNPLKIPRNHIDVKNKIASYGFDYPLSEDEINLIISETDLSRKDILEWKPLEVMSLEYESCDKSQLSEIIPDISSNIEDKFTDDEIEEIIDRILNYLGSHNKYKDILEEWIYSYIEGSEITQRELAVKYNYSQSYVSRVIERSIKTLKEHENEIKELFGY